MIRPVKITFFALLPLFVAGLMLTSSCAKKKKTAKEKTVRVILQALKAQTFQDRLPVNGTIFPV